MKREVSKIAKAGRFGDNEILHVSKSELRGLDALSHSIYGKGLPTNPTTGAKEAAVMFLPMAASMLGLGGSSALTTGAIAGGLGMLEAKMRGSKDPFWDGVTSGITAGALTGIGNAFTTAAGGAQGAADGAIQGMTPDSLGGAFDTSVDGMFANTGAAMPDVVSAPAGDYLAAEPFTANLTDVSAAGINAAPIGDVAAPASGGFMDSMTDKFSGIGDRFSTMGKGIENIMSDPEVASQFGKDVTMPAMAGAGGLMLQEDLDLQAGIDAAKQADEDEKKADEKKSWDMIRGSYAANNRDMPRGYSGAYRYAFNDGGYVASPADGMADQIPAVVDGQAPASLGGGEYVIPADVVSGLGNGNTQAGAQQLDMMIARIRQAKTGNAEQPPAIDPKEYV